jgi:hypothetical protein
MKWVLMMAVGLVVQTASAADAKQKAGARDGENKTVAHDSGSLDPSKIGTTSDAGVVDAGATLAGGFSFGQVLRAKGDLSKDEIKTVVKKHNSEIGACYQALLARSTGKQPVPQGTATLKFTVDQEGTVYEAAIAPGGLDDPTLASCIVEKVLAWTFPKPRGEGPVKVTFPLKLVPEE